MALSILKTYRKDNPYGLWDSSLGKFIALGGADEIADIKDTMEAAEQKGRNEVFLRKVYSERVRTLVSAGWKKGDAERIVKIKMPELTQLLNK